MISISTFSPLFFLFASHIWLAGAIPRSAKAGDPERNYDKQYEFIERVLKGNYNPSIPPPSKNGTIVAVNFYVRSINKLDSTNMEYELQLTFRQQWLDTRLAFDGTDIRYIYVNSDSNGEIYNGKEKRRIWTPDTFFSNEKKSHMNSNQYYRILPNGEVLSSARITLTLSCPMALLNFPKDTQICSIRISSLGYTTRDIIYIWKQVDPVHVTSDLHLSEFSLTQFATNYCDAMTNTGTYSCLRADFSFKREMDNYLKRFHFTIVLYTATSWMAFWLDPADCIKERILLGLGTIIAVSLKSDELDKRMPRTSYFTLIDKLMFTTFVFVIAAFMQSVFVNFVNVRDWMKLAKWADIICRAVFPIGFFIIFIVLY